MDWKMLDWPSEEHLGLKVSVLLPLISQETVVMWLIPAD